MKEEPQRRPSVWPAEAAPQCGLTVTMEAEPESSRGCSECLCCSKSDCLGKGLYLPTLLNLKSQREGLLAKAFLNRASLQHDRGFNPNLILHH